MKQPSFSIIIPTLNEEVFLPVLLSSLVEQTKRSFEVIVVDGRSTDKTVVRAASYKRKLPSLSILKSPMARLPLQRNLGATKAKGEWLVFVDADSVFHPYFIERVSQYIACHDAKLLTTWASPDSENPKDAEFTLFANVYVEATRIFKRPIAPGPLTIVHRSAFDAVGGYDEQHTFHEDVDFGLRLHKKGITLSVIPEALYVWSLRRFRHQGVLKVMNQYVISLLPIFFNHSLSSMPGYVMGGHLYGKKKRVKPTILKAAEKKLKAVVGELFS